MSKKTAIILFNSGGPDKPESIKGFLFNFFNDKAIIGLIQPFRFLLAQLISLKRNKITKDIYDKIGGKSPILEITNAQGEVLEKELSFVGDFKVFVSMRYWHPFSSQVIKKVKDYAPDEIILLPLYPQFSSTTTKSSFDDFCKKLKKSKIDSKLKYVCCYPTNPQFVSSHSRLILNEIAKAKSAGFQDCRLLFCAHGLPQKLVDAKDPYCFQVKSSVDAIISKLEEGGKIEDQIDHLICYQSKSGAREWTKPSLEFEIRKAALENKSIIIIPIDFVSDNSETLVGLDIKYDELAEKLKIPFYTRVPTLNVDGYFIDALLDICKRTSEATYRCNGGEYGERICPKDFGKCINPNLSNKNI
ncbi:MAG: ferrochelatase [Myxococcota bacterium]|jgi:ferrochelatase